VPRRISGSSTGGQTPGKGDWYVTCDRAGVKFPASQTRQEWNGLRVWEGVFEERHPLDTPRSARSSAPPPFTRSTPQDVTSAVIIPSQYTGL